MSLAFYLDKGASFNLDAACLTCGDQSWSYRDVATLSRRVAVALRGSGISPGTSVGILSANDPIAFTCVFGIARAEGVWCPVNPRNSVSDNRDLLRRAGCTVLIYQPAFEAMAAAIAAGVSQLRLLVRLGRLTSALPASRTGSASTPG